MTGRYKELLLSFSNVGGFRTFVGIDHVEFHRIAFSQAFESISCNRRVMHKHIAGSIPAGDETIAFLIIEPLYFSLQDSTFLIRTFPAQLRRVTSNMR